MVMKIGSLNSNVNASSNTVSVSSGDLTQWTSIGTVGGYTFPTTKAVGSYTYTQRNRIAELYESAKRSVKFFLPLTILERGVLLLEAFSGRMSFKSYDGDIALPIQTIAITTTDSSGWNTSSMMWWGLRDEEGLTCPGGRANGLLDPTLVVMRI